MEKIPFGNEKKEDANMMLEKLNNVANYTAITIRKTQGKGVLVWSAQTLKVLNNTYTASLLQFTSNLILRKF